MIGVVGASGLIGRHVYADMRAAGFDVMGTFFSTPQTDLVRFDVAQPTFSIFRRCRWLIVCAAVSRIDQCRLQPDHARTVNVEGTLALLRYALDNGTRVVFLSSDRVFSGAKGDYSETDLPDPITLYGEHKLAIEQFLHQSAPEALIFRLSKVFSPSAHESSLYRDVVSDLRERGRALAAVDQIFNPTPVSLVSKVLRAAMEKDLRGLYHLADRRVRSRFEFAREVATREGFDPAVVSPIEMRCLPIVDNLPVNTSLNVTRLEKDLNILLC